MFRVEDEMSEDRDEDLEVPAEVVRPYRPGSVWSGFQISEVGRPKPRVVNPEAGKSNIIVPERQSGGTRDYQFLSK